MIRDGEYIDDEVLLDTLGRDGTIVVPMHGGSDRRLPSGEILDVLAQGAEVPVRQVLAKNFRMDKDEIAAAEAFMNLVQFAGDTSNTEEAPPEQPFQPVDH